MTSFIVAPPAFIFQIALLTLPCLEQADHVPTPTERLRQVSDVIADIALRWGRGETRSLVCLDLARDKDSLLWETVLP